MNSVIAARQMREHRGPYYAHWLVTSRDELQRRLRKLEAEIMRLDKEESDGDRAGSHSEV